jgi:hypothetical protein
MLRSRSFRAPCRRDLASEADATVIVTASF